MSRRILDLSMLPWQFGRVERQPFGAQPIDDRASVTEWLPARVPGDVRADLIAAGRIPPIETPEGIAAGAWVDDYDWWYRAELPGDLTPDEVAILEADGIDYYSASRAQGADRKAAPLPGPDAGPSTGSGPGLAAAIAATQRTQATALQVGIEACRLRRETQQMSWRRGTSNSPRRHGEHRGRGSYSSRAARAALSLRRCGFLAAQRAEARGELGGDRPLRSAEGRV